MTAEFNKCDVLLFGTLMVAIYFTVKGIGMFAVNACLQLMRGVALYVGICIISDGSLHQMLYGLEVSQVLYPVWAT